MNKSIVITILLKVFNSTQSVTLDAQAMIKARLSLLFAGDRLT